MSNAQNSDQIQVLSNLGQEQLQSGSAQKSPNTTTSVENAPQTKLERFIEQQKIVTTINGVDVSYLTKFVLPYQDAYEKFERWNTAEDIALI